MPVPINILPPEVVEKIAAGEVIERPASVVKELIENALDAGARRIEVRVRAAGLAEITVSDDGTGISAGEVPLALKRHATSKIHGLEDLQSLSTLGFRGEALAAIAAVATISLVTRARGEDVATSITAENGNIGIPEPASRDYGTTVRVMGLFSAIPARRKFLRHPATENKHIVATVAAYALAHHNVGFSLWIDDRLILQTYGAGLQDAARRILGPEVADELLPLSAAGEGMELSGFLSPPHLHRASGREIEFLVNGRRVEDRVLLRAVMDAYRAILPAGRYPIVVLLLRLRADLLDVNVHPAKAQVRYSCPDAVYGLVYNAARQALSRASPPKAEFRPQPRLEFQSLGAGAPVQAGMPLLPRADGSLHSLPPLRTVGQIHSTYIVAEGPDGLYLVDQHAAHERILYERFLREREAGSPARQALLAPIPIRVGAQRALALPELAPKLAELGFALEPFGPETVLLREVPALLAERPAAIEEAFLDALDALSGPQQEHWLERTLVRLVCHAAIRAGDVLDLPRMRQLLEELERTEKPRTCPHGRPTMLYWSADQVQLQFRRR